MVRPLRHHWFDGFGAAEAQRVAALALIALGVALRFSALGRQSLWLDEATSLQFAHQGLVGCLLAEVNNPPLHRLLLHGWVALWGDPSDAWLRVPAAVAGSLTLPVFYALARRLLAGWGAVLALAIFALAPYHLLFSQEARAYALLGLLTCLAWWLHLTSLEPGGRWRVAALAAALTLGLYTHYQFVWVAAGIVAHRLWRARVASSAPSRALRALRLVGPVVLAALLFAPWVWVFLERVGPQARGYITGVWGRILSLPFVLLLGQSAVVRQYPETPAHAALRQLPVVLAFGATAGPLLVFGVRRLWRQGEAGRFLLLSTGGTLVALGLLFPVLPLLTARYVSFLIPVACLLVAAGAVAAWGGASARARHWAAATLVAVLIGLEGLSLGRTFLDSSFGRESWRAAAAWVARRARAGDVVFFDHGYVRIPFARYYQGPARLVRVPGSGPARGRFMAQLRGEGGLRPRERPGGSVFLVLSHHWDVGEQAVRALRARLCQREHVVYRVSNGIELFRFTRCGGAPRPRLRP